MERKIFIIAESTRGAVTQETYELITFAKGLSGELLPEIIIMETASSNRPLNFQD
jgi:hypothetical protein